MYASVCMRGGCMCVCVRVRVRVRVSVRVRVRGLGCIGIQHHISNERMKDRLAKEK